MAVASPGTNTRTSSAYPKTDTVTKRYAVVLTVLKSARKQANKQTLNFKMLSAYTLIYIFKTKNHMTCCVRYISRVVIN